ncbi:MAG TPA: hypothetical protein VMY05_04855 [Acidobacteriota bacterium]|nr:hypothetical protein [Acidobacteriota bacterium]
MTNTVNAQEHAVVIFEDSREGSLYKVTSCRLLAQKYDSVFFRNFTGVKVKVQFQGPSPFDADTFELVPGEEDTKPVASGVSPGAYPYDALCGPQQVPAEGSRPIIIIYK